MKKKIICIGVIIMSLISLCACGKEKKEEVVTKEYTSSEAMGLNPILPLYEYIPDGEPHVFGDRVYLYGSHDKFDGNKFCMNDYVVYSASVNDLENWSFEGVSFSKTDDPRYEEGKSNYLYAPDVVQGKDGKYYLFYCLDPHSEIGVAVSDSPAGPFEYYGLVKHSDGIALGQKEGDLIQFDPGVFIDEDGSIYLYSGNAPRFSDGDKEYTRASQVMQLEDDMLTLKTEAKKLLCDSRNSAGTGFEGHEFFEASSLEKIDGTYYLIYSSVSLHELCYATSKYPDKDFEYGGVLISNVNIFEEGDAPVNRIGNNHGSMELINGQWYIFYHRHTNGNSYSRQACAERIYINKDGTISQVEMTTTGLSSVSGKTSDWISAGRASVLLGNTSVDDDNRPYVTQLGRDREDEPFSIIDNIADSFVIGFKYFNCDSLSSLEVSGRGDFVGTLEIRNSLDGEVLGTIEINCEKDWKTFSGEVSGMEGDCAVYFTAKGEGTMQMEKFRMSYSE